MKEWAIQIINTYGYFGILLLTALESIFPVIPAEIILTLSGFMTTYTDMSRNGVILSATLGEMAGAFTLYSIGRFFSQERLEHMADGRIGRLIKLDKTDLSKARYYFTHKGKYTVLFCRCIPVLGSLISIPAGMAQMNLFFFTACTLIGITLWNTVLVCLGIAAKTSWEIIAEGAGIFSTAAACLFILIVLVNVFLFWHKPKKETP